jgi:modulator of FtsH protease HflK
MKRLRWVVWAALGLLLVGWLLTGLTEIRRGERAVVRRFGRVLDVQPRPGLWVGLPWGIDRIDKVVVEQVRRVTVGYRREEDTAGDAPPGQLLTGDHNLVNVQVVLNYAVDPDAVIDYVMQGSRAEDLIARTAESVLADWVAGRTVDDVLLHGKKTLPQDLMEHTQPRLDAYHLGVRLRGVDVSHLSPPQDVKDAFDQVAQAEAKRKTRVLQARQAAEQQEARTTADVRKIEEETRAYAANRSRLARAEATYFEARLQAFRDNPLVREAGRWTHLVKMVTRLAESGQLTPLDPNLAPALPGTTMPGMGKEKKEGKTGQAARPGS